MKFNINTKLFLLSMVPVIALLLFSLNHISEKYNALEKHKTQLVYTGFIFTISDLMHEVQLERGLSSGYLNMIDKEYFKNRLTLQLHHTDTAIGIFERYLHTETIAHLDTNTLAQIQNVKKQLLDLTQIREDINQRVLGRNESFNYYSIVNNTLLEITKSLKLHSNEEKTNIQILILQKLIALQEYAAQERAVVTKLASSLDINRLDIQQFHTLQFMQKQEYQNIIAFDEYSQSSRKVQAIHQKYLRSYFHTTRVEIEEHVDQRMLINNIYKIIGYGGMIHKLLIYKKSKNRDAYNEFLKLKVTFDKLMLDYIKLTDKTTDEYKYALTLQDAFDEVSKNPNINFDEMKTFQVYSFLAKHRLHISPSQWFEISTERIDEFNDLENNLFETIIKHSADEENSLKNALLFQITFTLCVIAFILFGSRHVSHKIIDSVNQLDDGLKNFFEFLNFKRELPNEIYTNSNDEIEAIAQKINSQMLIAQENLEDDKDFIHEATQIVKLMKEGDFSERVYFNPNNPNLVELKAVLNELIELIASKIKEQTTSLQSLNNSLEDKVFHQTLELHKQVEELTIARDKAIQAEIAKDEFLANMSHEIRTPLNAILGFVTILKKITQEEKSLEYLNIIDKSGQSLLTIINDILDFSKIQSGKFRITKHAINPVEEFSNAVLLFASKAYEKHLLYVVYIDPNMPSSIHVDSIRIKQIITNLLSNAIKFTPEDGTIIVNAFIKENTLFISIQDSGIGISSVNQKKIFTAFEQADGSTTRKYGGTGLGLSISSKLASLMGGKISIESKEGAGATFTLELPIEILSAQTNQLIDNKILSKYKFAILSKSTQTQQQTKILKQYLNDFGVKNILELSTFTADGYDILFFEPDDEYNEDVVLSDKPSIAILRTASIKLANIEHIQPLYAPFVPKSIIETLNEIGLNTLKSVHTPIEQHEELEQQYLGSILVAEDNKTNQMLISLILDDYGLEYEIANNGIEAIKMFKNAKYDLVLMDENMPELNGIGAMKEIKKYEKEKSLVFTPIIALTASVLDTDKEMFLNAGMDGFVGKPIDTKELEHVFEQYLHKA
jgi:signal transduction histidine kinase/ActR/RegA family two-component response regulator